MQYKVKAHGNKNKGDNKVNKTIVKWGMMDKTNTKGIQSKS
jgi:hypothetical protein